MSKETDNQKNKESLTQGIFITSGLVMIFFSISMLSKGAEVWLTIFYIGLGITFIGYSFSPKYFTNNLGDLNAMSKLSTIITIVGSTIIIINEVVNFIIKWAAWWIEPD